jgi:hypothetical protein
MRGETITNELTQTDVIRLHEWFENFVDRFQFPEPEIRTGIELKRRHTFRVCAEMRELGQALELNPHDLRIAEIIALFHDLGRFEQYAIFRKYTDAHSTNHAELSVTTLQKESVLDFLDQRDLDLIYQAISYHNRALLPAIDDERTLFFTKLIRDADKLDIFWLVTDYYSKPHTETNAAIVTNLPDSPGFSDEIYRSVLSGEMVDYRKLKNINDFKILQSGWIFDINFIPTLKKIRDQKYLQSLRQALPEDGRLDELYTRLFNYLAEKITQA